MKIILVSFICLFFATELFADVGALNSLLQNFSSLQASFTEVIATNQGSQTSSGTLSIQKPDQFRFEVKSPDSELSLSNGHTLWNVEPDLEQVTVSKLGQNISTTPLLLLSGNIKDIQTLFKVTQIDAQHYSLVPVENDSMLKQIILGFDAAGIVNFLQITNTMGQVSKLTLTHVMTNQPLAASLFNYSPPAGMAVLQQ